MTELAFWDVDTQHDFMDPDGSLYVPDAERLTSNLKRLTRHARTHGIVIVASMDDHTLEDAEISLEPDFERTFPPHCMHGTDGQRKIPATAMRQPVVLEDAPEGAKAVRRRVEDHAGEILIKKRHLDVFTNPHTATVLDVLSPRHVVLYGVALDVCARMAVEGLLARGGCTVHVVTDAVQAIHPEAAPALLDEWGERGVRTTTTDEVVDGGYPDRLS